ncbi:MAG: FHA domain-containing protein [Pseudomonadota bacterium]
MVARPQFPITLLVRPLTGEGARESVTFDQNGAYSIGRDGCTVTVAASRVSRKHATITISDDGIRVADLGSTNGTTLGGQPIKEADWDGRVPLVLGDVVELTLLTGAQATTFDIAPSAEPVTEFFGSEPVVATDVGGLFEAPTVRIADLSQFGERPSQSTYAAVGGGIGSFVWVDFLRVYGVPSGEIAVFGDNRACYANYERYCKNSQIPDYERLRSNSASTPDNVWGFPGYATREAARDVVRGRVGSIGHMFAVFGEPTFAQSYVPKAGNVFRSLDREMKRIGWGDMLRHSRVSRVRKTDDGRYAILYRGMEAGAAKRVHLAKHLHVAVGYPAVNFVSDFAEFIARHPSHRGAMVNAYDPHEWIYDAIKDRNKATVAVRGRGIVASRIVQRLAEERKKSCPGLTIVHLVRGERKHGTGSRFRRAQRPVFNDVEIQPFNWPKACWGGSLRTDIETMPDNERADTFAILGGTTTASRKDWEAIAEDGKEDGWYRKVYGSIRDIQPAEDQVNITVKASGAVDKTESINADFVVDCTGLIADLARSPFLSDLIETYGLQRNVTGRAPDGSPEKYAGLKTDAAFEVSGLRTNTGRAYVSGQLAGGGPYAPVDSFLGLQYAALRAVDDLCDHEPSLSAIGPFGSATGWLKWCAGARP